MNIGWVLGSAVSSFVISALIGKWLVPFLKKVKYGQTILEDGPKWHEKKQGTPTMGGFMFIIGSVVTTLICTLLFFIFTTEPQLKADIGRVLAGIVMACGYGAIGFIDDYIKVVKKRNLGLTAKQKLLLQFAVAISYLATLYLLGTSSNLLIPYVGFVDLGIFYWIFSAIAIVGVVNAVNLSDGIDGLVGSMSFFSALAFMLLASVLQSQCSGIMASALAGGCLGFLLWNFHPAKVFMGDTGSLFLGGYICAIAYALNMPIILIVIALPYLLEMLSVVLQVTYFKLTHGKRLFKMSPIHHHFEMCGWSEVKIVVVFSVFAAVCGIFAVLFTIFGIGFIN
ncbi:MULTISPECIES: phospho-N-acetylmuramoyl-pentapeptide-transferase [unclassified Ruminococcus]|uniref:phospho-N-acetylmuramoyl-pentapeptide- transferase n=1 Tax=unclassified Ruminococcus TaxID=2608920 RepID=UPI00210DB12D|nr:MULTISPECIES: phospho-N-acetylmuramoyl-pentapeptide-transferase [unclassified Ruminococcus]MCQ4022335.1 phospho-N-acetylmuramoyl-pentapeptide-transferase [Ruminococcus sp. zg-924]MCQ4114663.1 phospho-N-acetylmuramoyl-pentapeptide-transferase [Ruminococcus sp. zg-921]